MSYSILPFTDMSQLTLWLWNLSQRQRQVDSVARRHSPPVLSQDSANTTLCLGHRTNRSIRTEQAYINWIKLCGFRRNWTKAS